MPQYDWLRASTVKPSMYQNKCLQCQKDEMNVIHFVYMSTVAYSYYGLQVMSRSSL